MITLLSRTRYRHIHTATNSDHFCLDNLWVTWRIADSTVALKFNDDEKTFPALVTVS